MAVLVISAVAILGTGSGDELLGKLKLKKVVRSPLDYDGDGIPNQQELCIGSDPLRFNRNADDTYALSSQVADRFYDHDLDEVSGVWEWAYFNDYRTDPCDPDTDNDGYSDGEELLSWNNFTNPLDPCDPRPHATACMTQGASIERR